MSTTTLSVNPSQNRSMTESHQHDIAQLLEAAAQASAIQESSGESGDEVGEGLPDGAQKPEKRTKRSRACQACRNMKIRCNPVEGQEACLACSKVNRQCVMPGPARKRQKTVHKVAELEKKINALTQSLLAKQQANPTPQQSPIVTEGSRSTKTQSKESPGEASQFPLFPKHDRSVVTSHSKVVDPEYEDVIDRGVVSFATADRIFDKFVCDMNPLCPLISFPPGTTFDSIRRSRPMLSLAILGAACVALVPEIYGDLAEELAKQLAHRVFFIFERSLDLIQASFVQTTWIGKHKSAKDIGFNQYIHSAIVMAHDLGLSKRLKTPLTKDPVEEAELRRTWLACYWCGMSVSTTLRHPAMIRNSEYTQECLTFLAKSPAALSTDKTLCSLVKVISILEDVASCFHMDDPASTVRVEDSSTQYSLRLFEKRLEDWRIETKGKMHPGLMELFYATGSIYVHEIALHTDHNVDDFRPPAGRPGASDNVDLMKDDFITPAHLDGLAKCVVAMKSALDTFLSICASPNMRQIPCIFIVWTAYAAVAMIRLDGALRASNSKYSDLFLPDLKVEYYLDAIIERLNDGLGPEMTGAPVHMFVHAFQKLKAWHKYRLAGAVPGEYADIADLKEGMQSVHVKTNTSVDNHDPSSKLSSSSRPTQEAEKATTSGGPAPFRRINNLGYQQQQQQNNIDASAIGNVQGFDTQGGSWLTNSSMPIDTSMFENQDWNFNLEDWSIFEQSMVQPAGGTWLGYLL